MRPRKLIYVAAGVGLLAALAPGSVPAASAQHAKIDCASAKTFCTEVLDSEQVFGNNVYVDDISIGSLVGMDEAALNDVSVFPVPSNGMVTVRLRPSASIVSSTKGTEPPRTSAASISRS